ncbi:AAA family ATPase [Glaesserella parasuis]|uniref:AAA family ATPase n=1 Tax=Glaesserella parasuis TaxID=738 RepID=UPI0013651ABA|nr:AAA family ATPase [Glaesserella parasuis]MCT8573982.1 AAA family ATPase [Glaesserella parasuis]MCT8655217.1 AAA family ATPase [Glaesserella parasuis]MCT8836962.1 AAA family ATPase [Glaesserella parasuis]MDG6309991.1 AAA family ATPase [Glaesserella parasuis]MDG6409960.1 AAA family ATPase [Glaesserella parasuis]
MKNQQLNEFMKAQGLGQKQVANAFGVSVAAVSQYLNGKYQGDTESLDRKVDELLERHKAKVVEAKYNAKFVPTLAARRGMEVMQFAHVEGEINVIFGAAGLGKTQMMKQYARENSSAILLEIDPSCSPKVLLRKVAEAVGANARGNNNDVLDGIVSKLKGSERLLMIDEAELLSTRSLEFVRRIHDLTGIGVVLAGMPRLIVNLKGKNNELAQLYSRVAFACDLGNALPDDDLALLAESALGTDEFNAPLLKACRGNARRLSKLMRGVVRLSHINECQIDERLIKEYTKMLIG